MSVTSPGHDVPMLVIDGLRSSGTSAEIHVTGSILSMLRLMPGVALTVRAGVVSGDAPRRLSITVSAESARLLDEIAVLVEPLAQTTTGCRTDEPSTHTWVGRPESASLGFTPKTGATRRWRVAGRPAVADLRRIWPALMHWPDGHLVVGVTALPDDVYQIAVSIEGEAPPTLALRGALTDALPGLVFEEAVDGCNPGHMACDAVAAELVLTAAIPLSYSPIPGFGVASPAPLPVALTAGMDKTAGGLAVGTAMTDAGVDVTEFLDDAELLRHVHAVGATGTGKSTMLAGIVHQLAHGTNGALVLDPHGTLVDRILAELPASAAERCLVVRADDLDNPVPMNPLAAQSESSVESAIADIGQMFYELFDPKQTGIVGPRFEDRIAHALRGLALLRGPRASLLDVPLMLEHKGMRAALDAALTDPREKLWWRNESRNTKSSDYADLVAWCNSKFERFSASPALRAILGSGHDAYDPTGVMDDGRIVLVDLAKGQIGATASRLLGYLLLNRFWVAAMNREHTDRRFHVIVDEAHSVMAGSLVNMLSEGRKFGISVIAAHQFLGQLDAEVAEALSGNVGTSVMFRTNGPHVRSHVAATGDQVSAPTLAQLPTLTAIVTRTASTQVTAQPHTVRVGTGVCGCETADLAEVLAHTRSRIDGLELGQFDPDAEYRERTETTAKGSSFLDEWLAKRADVAEQSSTGGQTDRVVPSAPEPMDQL